MVIPFKGVLNMGGKLGFIAAILLALPSIAASKCDDLIQEIKSMQNAQKQLLQSLSQKNEMIATVLDQNADKLEKKMTVQRALKKSDLYSLRVSAKAFRNHEQRESALIERFEKASAELLDQVQTCIASQPEDKN
jgi:hypothetical protein